MNVDAYLTVMFWFGIIGLFCRAALMLLAEYPRKTEVSVGSDTLGMIICIAMFVWVCLLKFS